MIFGSLQPKWSYKGVADVPYPAPKIKSAGVHYVTPGLFNTVTIDMIKLIPIYLSEPYKSKMTKKFCGYNKTLKRNQLVTLNPCK